MTRVEYFKRWWIKQFGTITRKNGRWFWYREKYNNVQFQPETTKEPVNIVYSFHMVVSARHFYQLFHRVTKWDYLPLPSDTKYWIERSQSNVFRPGLDFLEYLQDMKGPCCLVIATPWEGDPLWAALTNHDVDKAFVSFVNKREQVLFKLAHT
ncbi:hypothetical protein D3C87_583430 [compost metagenome]